MKSERRNGMKFIVQGLSSEDLARVNGGLIGYGLNCENFSCSVNRKNCFDEYCGDVSCKELFCSSYKSGNGGLVVG